MVDSNSLSGWHALVAHASLCVLLNGCGGDTGAAPKEVVKQLAAQGRDAEVVTELDRSIWTNSSDIELLIVYCKSQFLLSTLSPTCRLNNASASEVAVFADALWAIWRGQTSSARTNLQDLESDPDWVLWSEAGLLELESHTQNYRELAAKLEAFVSGPWTADSRYADLYDRYAVALSVETANWSQLGQLLGNHSSEEIASSPSLFSAQATLFFVEGMNDQVGELLDSAPSDIEQTTAYLINLADYRASTTDRAWIDVVSELSNAHPDNRYLAMEKAFAELLDGNSTETTREALEALDGFAEASAGDVRFLMETAITLALYGQAEWSERIYRRIDVAGTSLEDFVALHVLAGWNAVYRGDLASANRSVDQALAMASRHFQGNYLKALIAKEQHTSTRALDALEILFDVDPYNENVWALIEDLRSTFGTSEWQQLSRRVEAIRTTER